MEDMRRIIREELRPLWKRIDNHDREIYGHNGTPGLTTKVDANTRHTQRVTWHLRAAWTAVLGFAGTIGYRLFGQ